jgi:hypothetical protein
VCECVSVCESVSVWRCNGEEGKHIEEQRYVGGLRETSRVILEIKQEDGAYNRERGERTA